MTSGFAEVSRNASPQAMTNRAAEKQRIGAQGRGGVEEKRAESVQAEPDEQRRLVAETPHAEARGNGEQEVAAVKGALNEAGPEVRELKGILELLDENVVEVIGDAPKEKEAGDERKGVSARRAGRGRGSASR